MAIVKAVIQAEINKLINETKGLEQEQAQTQFASKLADVIVNALKSAVVTVQPGIAVSTSGGAGATTAPGTGSLN
jgi:hypothetical protein